MCGEIGDMNITQDGTGPALFIDSGDNKPTKRIEKIPFKNYRLGKCYECNKFTWLSYKLKVRKDYTNILEGIEYKPICKDCAVRLSI